jgi:hypothetical protein
MAFSFYYNFITYDSEGLKARILILREGCAAMFRGLNRCCAQHLLERTVGLSRREEVFGRVSYRILTVALAWMRRIRRMRLSGFSSCLVFPQPLVIADLSPYTGVGQR